MGGHDLALIWLVFHKSFVWARLTVTFRLPLLFVSLGEPSLANQIAIKSSVKRGWQIGGEQMSNFTSCQ